jgi:hypothetical protein
MVAIMVLMESPAQLSIGLLMISYNKEESSSIKKKITVLKHSFTNGSVLPPCSLFYYFSCQQAEGIKPIYKRPLKALPYFLF